MTDAVAAILHGSICLVFSIRDLPCKYMAFDLLAGEGKKGAEKIDLSTRFARSR